MSISIDHPRAWTKARVIRALWELSTDGVAPAMSDDLGNLRYGCDKLFEGGYTEACREAGLLTHREGQQRERERLAPTCANPACDEKVLTAQQHCSRACTTAAQRARARQRLIAEVRARSNDGVAPPSSQHPDLRQGAHTHFGSWGALVEAAGLTAIRAATECKVCGGQLPRGRASYCSKACRVAGHTERRRERDQRRNAVQTERLLRRERIIDKYDGICQLCDEPINPDTRPLAGDAPALTTRERGQERTEENLILAHRACTVSRANRER